MEAYRILSRARARQTLRSEEIAAVVEGAARGSWDDAQLGAFLMAAAIKGLDHAETLALTEAMRDSGARWRLAESVAGTVDKHSTGGVGDKVSLIIGPLLAARGIPIAMLTGRALGHTGGTADKLESIPGLDLALDRERTVELLRRRLLAIGIATDEIAPADGRLYALRDRTATVDSIPLVIASILSKKLATGAAAIVFDVKVGDGAVFPEREPARQLARSLVEISDALECPASALLTDMSQPLGSWVGHTVEVEEALDCLSGQGDDRLRRLTLELAIEVAAKVGESLEMGELERLLERGEARELFLRWARDQGAQAEWVASPSHPRAPHEVTIEAPRDGVLSAVHNRDLGLLLAEAARTAGGLDPTVGLHYRGRLGRRMERGEEIARAWIRAASPDWERRLATCFEIDPAAEAMPEPDLVVERFG